jgi:hypothetical protein
MLAERDEEGVKDVDQHRGMIRAQRRADFRGHERKQGKESPLCPDNALANSCQVYGRATDVCPFFEISQSIGSGQAHYDCNVLEHCGLECLSHIIASREAVPAVQNSRAKAVVREAFDRINDDVACIFEVYIVVVRSFAICASDFVRMVLDRPVNLVSGCDIKVVGFDHTAFET